MGVVVTARVTDSTGQFSESVVSAEVGVSYDQVVLADGPVLFHAGALGLDASGNARTGQLFGGPGSTVLPNGDSAPVFNGVNQYVEVADHDSLSVPTTGVLTIEAWIRPDTLEFPNDQSTGYVHWMGKGGTGQGEWVARMYSFTTTDSPPRPNRISGYAYNLAGGLGTGGYFQDPVSVGEWIHYTFTINTVNTSPMYPTGYGRIWKNGQVRRTDSLSDYSIVPGNGTHPFRIGTRDFASWFQGAIGKVAVYPRELSSTEVQEHTAAMTV